MDRARHPRAARAGLGTPRDGNSTAPALGGGALRAVRWAALAASALIAGSACKALSPDFGAVIAIDVSLPDSGVIIVGDTLLPHARALDGRGDSTNTTVVWSAIDTTLKVVDSLTGATVGLAQGTGRLVARAGALRSNPATVTILAPLDSIVAVGRTLDTVVVSTPDSVSDTLKVQAFAGGGPATGRRIALSFDFPPGGTGVTLVPKDTIVTGSTGTTFFFVKLTGVRPDSAVVLASATSRGTPVAGSPIRFVVEFLP